jgi:hypothetical protein
MNYNFSSIYIKPTDQSFHLTTFSSKKICINDIELMAILVFHTVSKKCPFYLEIFPDEEKYLKAFAMLFDIFISADEKGKKALKYLAALINKSK